MTSADFIKKWRNSINYLNQRSVGIHVGWDLIPPNSTVENLNGETAWKKIYTTTPPWFKVPQTFQQLVNTKNEDYLQIVDEETKNGKLKYYRQKGILEPFFCAFSNQDGSFLLLGDGNHRFLDCIYLIHDEDKIFECYIKNTTVDIICLPNFDEVILPSQIWPTWNADNK